ncbi:hypothetical protein D9757_012756 [Collybiopsis confluens]|uniref:Protein kinase domain-containing protein n=1 Tax=Collybiopsis confluens TaxID=2823264 RepID=A0A8H5LRA7_9AGAR|nr:hypothetical protein D9757_012756 [Collybiopsis confluens]
MRKVLQVAKNDMPSAIKTLFTVLEGQKPDWTPLLSSVKSQEGPLTRTRAFTWPVDETQHGVVNEERIEWDIIHPAGSNGMDSPSLTVIKNDVTSQELIHRGFFSNIFKGSWRHRIVAVKVLELTTECDAFKSEIEAWKSLNHPNILRIYGASDPNQDPLGFSSAHT